MRHLHDPVLEEVRLGITFPVERDIVTHMDEVELGQIG
jgi:hypothetical protein